jgi:hypothetical protein
VKRLVGRRIDDLHQLFTRLIRVLFDGLPPATTPEIFQ